MHLRLPLTRFIHKPCSATERTTLCIRQPMRKRGIQAIAAGKKRGLITEMIIDLIIVGYPCPEAFYLHLRIIDEIGGIAPFLLAIKLGAVHLSRQLLIRMAIGDIGGKGVLVADEKIAAELKIILLGSAMVTETIGCLVPVIQEDRRTAIGRFHPGIVPVEPIAANRIFFRKAGLVRLGLESRKTDHTGYPASIQAGLRTLEYRHVAQGEKSISSRMVVPVASVTGILLRYTCTPCR